MSLIILPNQLFQLKNIKLPEINEIVLVEHPYYFTRLNFHKLRLAFLMASMLNYKDYLEKDFFIKKIIYISYKDYKTLKPHTKDFLKKEKDSKVYVFDPIDLDVYAEFEKENYEILESPMFLYNKEDLKDINYKRFNAFYNFSKKKDSMISKKYKLDFSHLEYMDKLNREKMSKTQLENFKEKIPIYKNKHYDYCIKHINKNFKYNFGELDIDNLSELAVTHVDAKKHLILFLKNKLNCYGPYQDFISKDHTILYHSNISYLLNSGLLTPPQVLKEVTKYESKVLPQSYEGFVRQIFWREYMRFLYVNNCDDLMNSNFWGNAKPLNWDKFYGKKPVGIHIIDDHIELLKRTAWTHHIPRMMVFLNYFILTEVHPHDVIRWFQEVISLDAAGPWVMIPNVMAMGYYSKSFMSKPYFTSANYLRKLSDYTIEPKLDELYKAFVEKKKHLKFYRY
jgi:deoxyribodipyrimidine photolyase-related protein